MSLKTNVKVSNITNLSDARYCAGMGVDMLGFSIDPASESYVSPEKLKEIRSWVAGVEIVVETNNPIGRPEIDVYNPDIIQISNPYLIPTVRQTTDKPLILSIEANQGADTIDMTMQKCSPFVKYFLLESTSLNSVFGDWPDFLKLLSAQFPILLGFGITPTNANSFATAGLALKGSSEIRPGFKDFGELMDILEVLEA